MRGDAARPVPWRKPPYKDLWIQGSQAIGIRYLLKLVLKALASSTVEELFTARTVGTKLQIRKLSTPLRNTLVRQRGGRTPAGLILQPDFEKDPQVILLAFFLFYC